MENRRLLLAAFVSALILITWNILFPPPTQRPTPAGEPSQEVLGEVPPPSSSLEVPEDRSVFSEPEEAVAELPDREPLIDFGDDLVEAEREKRTVIETEAIRAEFSNRGAQLVSVRLKQHSTSEGEEIELIKARGVDPYPFALVVGGERSHRLNSALFVVSEESDPDGQPVLRFRHRSARGAAEKIFRGTPDGLLAAEITVVGEDDWSVFFGPGLRDLGGDAAEDRFLQRGVGYHLGENLEIIKPGKQGEDQLLPAFGLRWLSIEDNFFLAALIPRSGTEAVLVRPVIQRAEFEVDQPRFLPSGTQIDEEGLSDELFILVEAAGEQLDLLALFDAKRYSRLAEMPYGLEGTVRWGWFGFLAKPLYFGLEWIYRELTPNYGWAIVLITLLIKLLFFPMTHKSQESMGKMQELNPKVQAIRTKYWSKLKDKQGRPNVDAQRQMNEEVMKVYKSAGVNPASGCLPLLLQMPVFFAFFRVLSTAVELRNAPWIGWIRDLSRPDPFLILPILMGVTSVIMQRMMPTSPDPVQRRIMQMMPIVFTLFALAFPSGLVLYWVTNNLLTMAQQALILKMKNRKAEAGS